LYCSGDKAPVCSNTKLLGIALGDDDPFEVAVCDDNDCFVSVVIIDVLVPIFVPGFNRRNAFYITGKVTVKSLLIYLQQYPPKTLSWRTTALSQVAGRSYKWKDR